jgi:hypothetical protein
MTVKELRAALAHYPDDTQVLFFLGWDHYADITNVADQDNGTVLLGEELPPECYVTDYKYEC